jgi:hypothetical protein
VPGAVLFALYERYFVNEKGSVEAVSAFPSRPSNFERVTEHLLGHLGHWPPGSESASDNSDSWPRRCERCVTRSYSGTTGQDLPTQPDRDAHSPPRPHLVLDPEHLKDHLPILSPTRHAEAAPLRVVLADPLQASLDVSGIKD